MKKYIFFAVILFCVVGRAFGQVTLTPTNVSCPEMSDGQIKVDLIGTAPFTLQLFVQGTPTPVQTISNLAASPGNYTGLAPGNYTVIAYHTVGASTKFLGQSGTTIGRPDDLQLVGTVKVTQLSCFSIVGTIELTVGGGSEQNYTFTLTNTGTSVTTNRISATGKVTFNNLVPGTYTIGVVDEKGCTFSVPGSYTITPYITLGGSVKAQTPVTCFGYSDGTVTLIATGGRLPYTYGLTEDNINFLDVNTTGYFTGLPVGDDLFVKIYDGAGCIFIVPFTIVGPTSGLNAVITPTNVTNCFGGDNGQIIVAATGGTPINGNQYTYTITGNGVNQTNTSVSVAFSALKAGTYTITITDAGPCSETYTRTLTQPNPVKFFVTPVNNICAGEDEGEILLSNSNLNYELNHSGIFSDVDEFTGLTQGTYIIVADSAGCRSQETTVGLTDPPLLNTQEVGKTNITCHDADDGTITVAASGGTPGLAGSEYSFSINGGATFPLTGLQVTFQNLSASGSPYTVIVKDASGCEKPVGPISIVNPAAVDFTLTPTPITCYGGVDGAIAISGVTGGTGNVADYQFKLEFGGNVIQNYSVTTGFTGLDEKGTYTVTVKDGNGCEVSKTVIITEPDELIIAEDPLQHVDVTCFGQTTGAAGVTVIGGTPFSGGTYQIVWSPSGGTGLSATGLGGGVYTITATDSKGCTDDTQITITPPTQLLAALTLTDITCNGKNDGIAAASPSGGNGPQYEFDWNDGLGRVTSNTKTGLSPNTSYTLRVYDSKSCYTDIPFTLTEPATMVVTPTQTNVDCYGDDTGAASVSATGGTTPYTYTWRKNDNTLISNNSSISDLIAETYKYRVEDAKGCFVENTVTITQSSELTAVFNPGDVQSVSCYNIKTGHAKVTVTGGTPFGGGTYQYSWSHDPALNNPEATGLGGGIYIVTVTDAKNCTTTATVTITPANPLEFVINVLQHASCFGRTDGIITVTATGGTAPYSDYQWNDAGSKAGQTLDNVGAGDYTISVKDANGCTADSTITVLQPSKLIVNVTKDADITCFGANDGKATVSVSGGALPNGTATYTYLWSPSNETVISAVQLRPGTNTVTATVVGSSNCSETGTIVINEPDEIDIVSVTPGKNPLECNGDATQVTVTAIGDPARTLQYRMTPLYPAWQTGKTFADVTAGTYTVEVSYTGSYQCTKTEQLVITENSLLTLTEVLASHKDVTCNGDADGEAEVLAQNGAVPYGYLWYRDGESTPISGQTGAKATGLTGGNYIAEVTDDNGCRTTLPIIITPANPVTALFTPTDITCAGADDGTITVTPVGGNGAPYSYILDGAALPVALNNPIGNLTKGQHTITIYDNTGCASTQYTFNIDEPDPIDISTISQVNATCFGGNEGSATIQVTGGSGNYTYAWEDASLNSIPGTTTISGLTAGTYTVTVTDAAHANCDEQHSVTITQPGELNILEVTGDTDLDCFGDVTTLTVVLDKRDNSLTVEYSINGTDWFEENNIFANMGKGNYTVTVRYKEKPTCTDTYPIEVKTPVNAVAIVSIDPPASVSIACGATQTITVTASGGSGNFEYRFKDDEPWQLGNTYIASSGVYRICVRDKDAPTCEQCAIDPIVVSGTPTISFTEAKADDETLDCAEAKTFITATVTFDNGKTVEVSYDNWTTKQTTDVPGTTLTFADVPAGIYYVAARYTDDVNCILLSNKIEIVAPNPLVITQDSKTDATGCQSETPGTVTISVTGGNGSYSYKLDNGSLIPFPGSSVVIGNLTLGSHTIDVTDGNNCVSSGPITVVIDNQDLMNILTTLVDVRCFADKNGEMTIRVSEGKPTYAVRVTGRFTTFDQTHTLVDENDSWHITGLDADTYTVLVTDDNGQGCSQQKEARILQPVKPLELTINSENACPGSLKGGYDPTTVGGWMSYQYYWFYKTHSAPVSDNYHVIYPDGNGDPINKSPAPDNLDPGKYQVVVLDQTLCTDTAWFEIFVMDQYPSAQMKPYDVRCNQPESGSIKALNTQGGLGGPYLFRVRDKVTKVTLPGHDYQIWPKDSITGLNQGDYLVDMLDSQASTCLPVSWNVSVGNNAGLTIEKISIVDPKCHNGNDGKITGVKVAGNALPLEYKLQYPNGGTIGWQNTAAFDTISKGDYKLFVREKGTGGCETVKDTTVARPTELLIDNISITEPGCQKVPQGYIEFDVMGGTGAFKVTFNDVVLTGTVIDPAINDRHYKYILGKGGSAIIKAEDANGCIDTVKRKIPYTTDLEITKVRITPNECPSDKNAVIRAIAKDKSGSPYGPFTYKLYTGTETIEGNLKSSIEKTNLADTAVFTGLPNGTYVLSVHDGRDPLLPCYTLDFEITITNKYNITIENEFAVPNSCRGKAEGRYLFTIVGVPSYSKYEYSLNGAGRVEVFADAQGLADVEIENLSKGDYTLAIFYGNCFIEKTFSIIETSSVMPLVSVDPVTGCVGNATGAIRIEMTNTSGIRYKYWYGASGPGVYTNFSPANGLTAKIGNLKAADYKLVVQSNNGCLSDTLTVAVPDAPPMLINYTIIDPILCVGKSDGKVGINISDGVAPYTVVTIKQPDYAANPVLLPVEPGYDAVVGNVTGGIYEFTITDNRGCTEPLNLDIHAPKSVKIEATHIDQLCDASGNAIDGSIRVRVTKPAAGTFVYQANTLTKGPLTDIDQTFDHLIADTYLIRVTEQTDGCLADTTITIGGITAPSVTINPIDPFVSCAGVSDGTFGFTVQTAGDYQYQLIKIGTTADPSAWKDGSFGTFSALAAGDYTLMISNKTNHCTWGYPVKVGAPEAITFIVEEERTPLEDCRLDITLTIVPQGGTAPYKYYKGGHAYLDSVFLNVDQGKYDFSIVDSKGCTSSVTEHIVEVQQPIIVTAAIVDVVCNKAGNGLILLSTNTHTCTYEWDNGKTGNILNNLNAGDYGVTVFNPEKTCSVKRVYTVRASYVIDAKILDKDHRSFCPDDQVVLNALVTVNGSPLESGSSAYATWILPSGEITNFTPGEPLVTKALTGTVQLLVTSESCSNNDTINLSVKQVPTLTLSTDKVHIPVDESFDLTVEASDFTEYAWTSVPEGYAEGLPSPPGTATLASPDQPYSLVLTLTGENGCSVNDTVFVQKADEFFIPNAFTPNDDGFHDTWMFRNIEQYTDYYNIEVAVFNRGGFQVYEGKEYNNSSVVFSGRRNGNDLPIGTYYYVVKLVPKSSSTSSETITYKGSVTIVR